MQFNSSFENTNILFGNSQITQPSRYGLTKKLKPLAYNPIEILEKMES